MSKGQQKALLWWVFGITVLVVMIIFIQAVGKNIYPSAQTSVACRATIEAMDKESGSILSYFNSGTKVPQMCETNWVGNLTVKEKKVENQKEELLDQIVPLVGDCWYQFGEGELDPFGGKLTLSTNRYCFVCSRFIIPKSFSSNISANSFSSYISKSKKYSSSLDEAFPNGDPFVKSVDIDYFPFYLGQDYLSLGSLSYSSGPDFAVVLYAVKPPQPNVYGSNYSTFIIPYNNLDEIDCNELVKKKRTE